MWNRTCTHKTTGTPLTQEHTHTPTNAKDPHLWTPTNTHRIAQNTHRLPQPRFIYSCSMMTAVKTESPKVTQNWVQVLLLSFPSSVAFGNVLTHRKLLFLHLSNGDNNSTYLWSCEYSMKK